MRTYRIKRRSNHTNPGAKSPTCTIGMPPSLAALIPEDTRFIPELTEDGLLYRLDMKTMIDHLVALVQTRSPASGYKWLVDNVPELIKPLTLLGARQEAQKAEQDAAEALWSYEPGHHAYCAKVPGTDKWYCDYRCPHFNWHDSSSFVCQGCMAESGLPVDHENWCDKA